MEHRILLGKGEKDTMVTFEETDYAHHLLKNSKLKIYEEVLHSIEEVSVELLGEECERFFD